MSMPGRAQLRIPIPRVPRPRLARLAAPLALVIAVLLQAYLLTFPISLAAVLLASPRDRLVSLLAAWVAVEWAYVGTYALVAFPGNRPLVEVIWTAFPCGLFAYGLHGRYRLKSSRRNTNQPHA